MRAIFLLIFCAALGAKVFAQSTGSGNKNVKNDTTQKEPLESGVLSNKDFNKIINGQFSSLLSGGSKSQIGNFASINPGSPSATFNYSINRSPTIFSFNLTAASTDGISSLFTNSSLNANISFEAKASFLARSKKALTELNSYTGLFARSQAAYALKNGSNYQKSSDSLDNDMNFKIRAAKNAAEFACLRYRAIIMQIAKLDSEHAEAKDSLINTLNDLLLSVRTNYQIDISNEIKKQRPSSTPNNSSNIIDLGGDSVLDLVQVNKDLSAYNAQLKKTVSSQKSKLLDNFQLHGFLFNWWDVSYKANNSSVNLFDPLLPYSTQVIKNNYLINTLSINFNRYSYNYSIKKLDAGQEANLITYYFTGGADLSVNNNLNLLKTINMQDIKTYASSPAMRQSIKTYTAYVDSGKYHEGLLAMRLHADYYRFLSKDCTFAYHIFPATTFSERLTPEYDLGFGFLFSFKDKKDTTGKAVVNSEFYCNFLDLTDSRSKGGNFFNRNDIGIRFTFPLTFTSSKNN